MQNRKIVTFAFLAFAAFAFTGALSFLSWLYAEPIVNGHRLGYWLDRTGIEQEPSFTKVESSEAYQRAIEGMDEGCVAALTNILTGDQPNRIRVVNNWFESKARLGRPFREPPDWHLAATLMLGRMGSRASNAIPLLEEKTHAYRVRISGLPDFDTSAAIASLVLIRPERLENCVKRALDPTDKESPDYEGALMILGTNAASCVPFLVDALKTAKNDDTKARLAYALGNVHSRSHLSFPVLVPLLKDPNEHTRAMAVYALGQFGAIAKPAWNDLLACLNNPDSNIRWEIADTMWRIDPTAAERDPVVARNLGPRARANP